MFKRFLELFHNNEGLEKKLEEKEKIISRYSEVSLQLKNNYLELKNKANIYERASCLFNEILSSMNSGILLIKPRNEEEENSRSRIIFINKFLLDTLGLDKTNIKEDPNIFLKFVDKNAAKDLLQKYDSLKRNHIKMFYTNLAIFNSEGKRRYLSINGRNTEYKGSKCIIFTVNDLTSEEEYRYKSNLFNNLFVSSSVGAVVIDITRVCNWIKEHEVEIRNNINFIEFNMVSIRKLFDLIEVKSLNRPILDILSSTDFYSDKELFLNKIFFSNKQAIIDLIWGIFSKKEEFTMEILTEMNSGSQYILTVKLIINPECYLKENYSQILLITKNFSVEDDYFSNSVSDDESLIQWRENSEGRIFSANKKALECFFGKNQDLSQIVCGIPTSIYVKEHGKPCRFYYRKLVGDFSKWFDLWATPMFNIKGDFIGIINLVFNTFDDNEEIIRKMNEDKAKFTKIDEDLYIVNN